MKDFSAAINFRLAKAMSSDPTGSGVTGDRKRNSAARAGGDGGGRGEGRSGGGIDLAPLYFNRALVHVCLGDDTSALDDLDRAVTRDTRNTM